MLVKLQESKNNENTTNIDSDIIEALSYDAGKVEREQDKISNKITPTEEDLSKLEAYLANVMNNKSKLSTNTTTKRKKKSVNVTPTPLEKSLFFSDEVLSEKPTPIKVKPKRKKKIELVVPELNEDKEYNGEIKKLVYKNRNAENNYL
jgi:septal ring factor EnvC (AmiA/AmiB activator)